MACLIELDALIALPNIMFLGDVILFCKTYDLLEMFQQNSTLSISALLAHSKPVPREDRVFRITRSSLALTA